DVIGIIRETGSKAAGTLDADFAQTLFQSGIVYQNVHASLAKLSGPLRILFDDHERNIRAQHLAYQVRTNPPRTADDVMIAKLAHLSRKSALAKSRDQFRLHHRLNYGGYSQRNPAGAD